ncbi:MAG: SH3 domain-containing protein, partial [Candidatus Caenarcaniphilales bacterium]|nr:SH3 domain-containing protein [Candidatus Caenarcaniphilales bacterium]
YWSCKSVRTTSGLRPLGYIDDNKDRRFDKNTEYNPLFILAVLNHIMLEGIKQLNLSEVREGNLAFYKNNEHAGVVVRINGRLKVMSFNGLLINNQSNNQSTYQWKITVQFSDLDNSWIFYNPDLDPISTPTQKKGKTCTVDASRDNFPGSNLRKSPSTDSEIILVIPNKREVTFTKTSTKTSGVWLYVTHNSQSGWIHSKYCTQKVSSHKSTEQIPVAFSFLERGGMVLFNVPESPLPSGTSRTPMGGIQMISSGKGLTAA